MTGGIGRNQKHGRFVIVLKPPLNRATELLTIHSFGGRGSPYCLIAESGRFQAP